MPHAQKLWCNLPFLLRLSFNYPGILGLTWSKGHLSCFQISGRERASAVVTTDESLSCSVGPCVPGAAVPFLAWLLPPLPCLRVYNPFSSQAWPRPCGWLLEGCPGFSHTVLAPASLGAWLRVIIHSAPMACASETGLSSLCVLVGDASSELASFRRFVFLVQVVLSLRDSAFTVFRETKP